MKFALSFKSLRSRNLALLAGAAAVCIGLAAGGLYYRAAVVAPKYTPMPLFPGLAYKLSNGEATHIYIVSKKYGGFEVAFIPQKGWVLPNSGNYPASFEMVQQTLVAIAAMQTIEPKTDRPDWFHYVDLDPPPQGAGTIVTLSADKGYILASMIAGKAEILGQDIGIFVRRAGENQSYLVRSPAEIKTNPADWMDKNVVALDRTRIASAEVRPITGPGYTFSRTKPDGAFTLTPQPKGRDFVYPGVLDATAAAFTDFTFDDIKPVTTFDFSNGARLTLHTFDGLTVTADLITQGSATWIRIYARGVPGNATAAKESLAINERAAAWAFKLPAYKVSAFAPPQETLLQPRK